MVLPGRKKEPRPQRRFMDVVNEDMQRVGVMRMMPGAG